MVIYMFTDKALLQYCLFTCGKINSIFPRTLILEAFPKLSSIHWENHEVLFFILNMSQSNPSFFIFHMIVNEKRMAVLAVHGFGD